MILLLGHADSVHDWLIYSSPWQLDPPLAGAGELHNRLLTCWPDPHVTEQAWNEPQDDHPPSTKIRNVFTLVTSLNFVNKILYHFF